MAELGKGYINVIPKFPGLASGINSALNGVNTTQAGEKIGGNLSKGMGSGVVKSGVVIGAVSAVANKAISSISSNIDGAISRFDTLNNYPRVMQSLGYSAEQADASLEKMNEKLLGLPTSLDSMVSTVQGFSVITGDLDLATQSALALNDMLLASGSSSQACASATEQFRQMLSKGKPDMQDWKSLVQTMPGQLDQLAKSMLGSTATIDDLYAALGGGKNEAIFSMDDLLNTIVRLDREGGSNFASFEDQARQATGGVATSLANLNTAVTRGLANMMQEIGQDKIAGVFNDLKGGINDAFSIGKDIIHDFKPEIEGIYNLVKQVGPVALAAGAGFLAFKQGYGVVDGLIGKVSDLKTGILNLSKGASFASVFNINPATLGITAGIALIGTLGAIAYKTYKEQESLRGATVGLTSALSDTSALDNFNSRIAGVGSSASGSKKSIDELVTSIGDHAAKINETNQTAQTQIATLNTARDILSQYAGQSDLSNDALGRMRWAIDQVNEQFGLNISELDVANGYYVDQNGKVQDLTKSIDDLVEAKKNEIRMNALSSSLSEAYQAQDEQIQAIAQQRSKVEQYRNLYGYEGASPEQQAMLAREEGILAGLESGYEDTKKSIASLESQLGEVGQAANETADSFDKLGQANSVWLQTLHDNGHDLSDLKTDLQALGVDTEKFAQLSEDQLQQVADVYDGTALSIVDALSNVGMYVGPEAEQIAQNAKAIGDAFKGMDLSGIEQLNGIDFDNFSVQLAQAGVSAEDFSNIATEDFAALAEMCGYNVDVMVAAIQTYNNTEIVDKDGNITVDTTTLIDAQGNIYQWNGTKLLDKSGHAVVDDMKLMDARGHVVEWNGSKLNTLTGSATVSTNIPSVLSEADKWNALKLTSKSASAVINFSTGIFGKLLGNAAGGLRLHANGAIATKATPLDIVGEDGAEAIVPLTNRKYSQPFIDLLADGINEKFDSSGNTYVNIHLAVGADASAKEITREIAREIKLHGLQMR